MSDLPKSRACSHETDVENETSNAKNCLLGVIQPQMLQLRFNGRQSDSCTLNIICTSIYRFTLMCVYTCLTVYQAYTFLQKGHLGIGLRNTFTQHILMLGVAEAATADYQSSPRPQRAATACATVRAWALALSGKNPKVFPRRTRQSLLRRAPIHQRAHLAEPSFFACEHEATYRETSSKQPGRATRGIMDRKWERGTRVEMPAERSQKESQRTQT